MASSSRDPWSFWTSVQTACAVVAVGSGSMVNVTEITHRIGTMLTVKCVSWTDHSEMKP
jgi:hypothetical protein